MPPSQPFIVLGAALLISTFPYCSSENVYCVTPTATSCTSCPHNWSHCATLPEYVQESGRYFTSNTTLVFLPGDHVLDKNVTVANVAGLTMRGESSSGNRATVVCSGVVGLSLTSMEEFRIDSLAFTSCNRKYVVALPGTIYFVTIQVTLLLQSTQYAELVNCSFHDNHGTALVVNNTKNTVVSFIGTNNFINNQVAAGEGAFGGAIFALGNTVLSFNGISNFINNSVHGSGGAIVAFNNTVLSFNGTNNFINNSATRWCGAICALNSTVLDFSGISTFFNNSAEFEGGAIYTFNNTVFNFNGISTFFNNSAEFEGGAIYTFNNTVFNFNGISNFNNNSAELGGGAIFTNTNSTLNFNGTISFTSNICNVGTDTQPYLAYGYTANGGGVYMGLNSTFSILPHTSVYWENNHATLGGAIYVQDASPLSYCTQLGPYAPKEECFFQLPGQSLSNGNNVHLIFKNNSADAAGSVLYGGAIDHCKLTHGLDSYNSGKVFDMIVHHDDTDFITSSNVSSSPFQICLCENHLPDCSMSKQNYQRMVYPGEIFHVSVVAVGQRDGAVPSTVVSTLRKAPDTNSLDSQYRIQVAMNNCTTLSYAVSSLSPNVYIDLHAESSPCEDKLSVSVTLYQNCPLGFNISESTRACVCEPRLAQYTKNCNITDGLGQITRDYGQHFWVGYDDQLILHPFCPLDYCCNGKVVFSFNNTDLQCAYNRTGLLCGTCKENDSLVLGTSKCKQCTNNYLVLLIPFALMGVALVFLLLVCNLTVATGTLSGLVIYANIVGVNRTIFLPVESTTPLSVFIAWLNLDLGIETCFYNGMDTYGKTWLQFVFPAYIWMLVGLVMLVSNYSHRFAFMLGNNPVSVLATLILLSYTKIVRTLIAIFSITYLEYPTYNRTVWLYDANIDYLSGKHIPLFIVAVLLFLFLFLPYTLLFLFGQWLQVISHLRFCSWVHSARLKPFMDAYHAPYKPKHRYWPGLLLVIRFVLLLVFALNPQRDPNINLVAILFGTGILHIWACICGGVYKNWFVDVLEGSFALNLIILATNTMIYYVSSSQGNRFTNWYNISVSIALVTFIAILAYHFFQQVRSTKLWKKVSKLNLKFNRSNIVQTVNDPVDNSAVKDADFSQLREPLLEDQPQSNYGAF